MNKKDLALPGVGAYSPSHHDKNTKPIFTMGKKFRERKKSNRPLMPGPQDYDPKVGEKRSVS